MTTAPAPAAVTAATTAPARDTRLRLLVVTSDWGAVHDRSWLLELLGGSARLAADVVTMGADPLIDPLAERGVTARALPGRRLAADVVGLVGALRRQDPDVVLADGERAAAACWVACTLTGRRVLRAEHARDASSGIRRRLAVRVPAVLGTPQDPRTAGWEHRLVGALASAVGRAGAGIDPASGPAMSLVVPVWNEGALVDELVESLLPQLRGEDELVLVDDASTDDTADRAERAAARLPQVTAVRRERNGRAGAARNSGVEVARHDVIAFTDAGCEWAPGWLDAFRTAFMEEPAPQLVSGSYSVSRDDPFQMAMAVGCYPDVRDVRRTAPLTSVWSRLFGRRFDATRPAGRSVAATRPAMDLVGGWPEGQIAHEDVDLARGIAEEGLRCVMTTDAEVLWQQAGPRATWAMYVRYGRGDALASDRQALLRDGLRAAAYVVGPALLLSRVGRIAALAGASAYFSVPVVRARREERPVVTALLVPLVITLKDVAKAWGAVEVLLERRSLQRRSVRSEGPRPVG